MSVKVTLHQLQEQLPELLDRTVESGEECVVQRDGEDYAVIIGAREWRRRSSDHELARPAVSSVDSGEAPIPEIGRRLDALGPEYRLSPEKQARIEELLDQQQSISLTPAERSELEALAEECDKIMLRRAQALQALEQQIREVLATETRAIPLSDTLFSPGGLFNRLAETEEERRVLVQSPLFKEAQRRLSTLQQQEAAEFARAVQQAEATLSESGYRLKMELTQ